MSVAQVIEKQLPNSTSFDEQLEAARQTHEAGQLDQAKTMYDALLVVQPNNHLLLHLKGALLFQKGQLEKALPLIEKAALLDPHEPRYLNTLGLVQRNMRQFDGALVSFQIALTLQADFGEALCNMGLVYIDKGMPDKALENFEKAIKLLPNKVELLVNYAHTLRDTGKLPEATEIYKRIAELEPNSVRHLLNLGIVLMMQNLEQEAATIYEQVLKIDPEEATAKHLLAGLKGENTQTAPDTYVASLFDMYADDFDRHLASLSYQVPEMLAALIPSKFTPQTKQGAWRILDLGCGTGACGVLFKQYAEYMVGVDLSAKMLKSAEEHNIYNELICASIDNYFSKNNEEFDLVFAADVYVYIGDLKQTFIETTQRMAKGALYAFSTELASEEEADFVLRTSGRYSQKNSYILGLAQECGLEVLVNKEIVVRTDAKGNLDGRLYLLQKK